MYQSEDYISGRRQRDTAQHARRRALMTDLQLEEMRSRDRERRRQRRNRMSDDQLATERERRRNYERQRRQNISEEQRRTQLEQRRQRISQPHRPTNNQAFSIRPSNNNLPNQMEVDTSIRILHQNTVPMLQVHQSQTSTATERNATPQASTSRQANLLQLALVAVPDPGHHVLDALMIEPISTLPPFEETEGDSNEETRSTKNSPDSDTHKWSSPEEVKNCVSEAESSRCKNDE